MTHHSILSSKEFKKLVSSRRVVSITMTAVMLLAYFGFILTVAFRKELFALKVGSDYLTLGIICGVGLIFLAWIMTGIYAIWANKSYDSQVQALRDTWKKSTTT